MNHSLVSFPPTVHLFKYMTIIMTSLDSSFLKSTQLEDNQLKMSLTTTFQNNPKYILSKIYFITFC